MTISETIDSEAEMIFTEEVTIEEIEKVVSRRDELDWVHGNRMLGIKGHILKLLDKSLSEPERKIEIAYLGHMGATTVLEYLPEV
jgi:hypothetical protein